jgi:hypothetical protein
VNTTALPGFCRLVLRIVTNPGKGKDAGAELWLPDEWNERLLGFGNGGWGGGGEYEWAFILAFSKTPYSVGDSVTLARYWKAVLA